MDKETLRERISSRKFILAACCLLVIIVNGPLCLGIATQVLQALAYVILGYIGFQAWQNRTAISQYPQQYPINSTNCNQTSQREADESMEA